MSSLRNHPLVKKYLNVASRDIRKSQVRLEIQEELFDHIESEVARLCAEGLSQDMAVAQAIEHLGSPALVSESFFNVYHRSWRYFLKIGMAFAMAVAVFIVATIYQTFESANKDQREYVASALPYFNEYLNDVQLLKTAQLFPPAGNKRDAGEILNYTLNWTQYPRGGTRFIKSTKTNLPNLVFNLQKSGGRIDLDDMNRSDAEYVNGVDLSWMSELKNYDHWDFYKVGPGNRYQNEDYPTWSGHNVGLPLPFLTSLRDLAMVRLHRSLKNRDELVAVSEVRDLARLAYSTETLTGAEAALEILHTEYVWAKSIEKSHEIAGYIPLSDELLDRAKRAIRATEVFMNYNLVREKGIAENLALHAAALPGGCGAYYKSVNIANMQKTNLKIDGPIDDQYTQNTLTLAEKMKSQYRLTKLPVSVSMTDWSHRLIRQERPKRDFKEDLLRGNLWPWAHLTVLGFINHVPFVRNSYGRYLAKVEQPQFPANYHSLMKVAGADLRFERARLGY